MSARFFSRCAALSLLTSLLPGPASAQSPGTASTFTEVNREVPNEDDVRLTLTGGATFAYGNARTLGLNLAGGFFVREAAEQLDIEVSYLLGMAEAPLTCNDDTMGVGCAGTASGARTGGFNGTWIENANNLMWRLRYDHYFDADNSFFAAHRGRRDTFAGLDARLGLQLGYSRVLFREENHRLSLDLGVDGTIDVFTDGIGRANRASTTFVPPLLQGTDGRFVPALRVYLAYTNHVNETLTYDTGVEVLWNVVNPGHFRFEWQNHIRSRLTGFLELSLDVTLRVDSQPPGQNAAWSENPAIVGTDMRLRPGQVTGMFDLVSTLNLVGSFDIDGAPPAAAEEPAEPACPEPAPCAECPTCAACLPAVSEGTAVELSVAPGSGADAAATPAAAAPAAN